MKTTLLVVLVALPAAAEESVLSKLSLGLDTVGAISLTQARTQGGIGGGVQAAFSFDEHWLVHARAAWLWGLGSHTLFHAGGGWQRAGSRCGEPSGFQGSSPARPPGTRSGL